MSSCCFLDTPGWPCWLAASPEYFLHDLKESFKFLKVHLPKIPRCFHFSQICSSKRRSVWAVAKFNALSQQTPSMPWVVQVYDLRNRSNLRHCKGQHPKTLLCNPASSEVSGDVNRKRRILCQWPWHLWSNFLVEKPRCQYTCIWTIWSMSYLIHSMAF